MARVDILTGEQHPCPQCGQNVPVVNWGEGRMLNIHWRGDGSMCPFSKHSIDSLQPPQRAVARELYLALQGATA